MFGLFKAKPRKSAEERRRAAIDAVLGDENTFVNSLMPDASTRGREAEPSFVAEDQPTKAEAPRPYLKLGPGELERYATLDIVSPGPTLEESAVGHGADLLERVYFGPLRTLIGNLFWLVVGGLTLMVVSLMAGKLLLWLWDLFRPVWT